MTRRPRSLPPLPRSLPQSLPRSRRAGYSLFEVLLAFAILTLVLAVLLPGQSDLLRRMGQRDARVLAQDFAQSEALRVGLDLPVATVLSRREYRSWQVEHEITAHPRLDGILHVVVTVRSAQGRVLAQSMRDVARP